MGYHVRWRRIMVGFRKGGWYFESGNKNFYTYSCWNEYEKGNKFYLYTGRGPSENVHIGHLVPWVFTKYLAKNEKDFFERLDHLMRLAKESLIIKREIIENLTFSGLHPYSRFYLNDVKKTFGEYWKNHFNTIGILGMNESVLNFIDKDYINIKNSALNWIESYLYNREK